VKDIIRIRIKMVWIRNTDFDDQELMENLKESSHRDICLRPELKNISGKFRLI
jgi:hypothetical protein